MVCNLPYLEKNQAGLSVLDCNARPIYATRFPERVYAEFEAVPAVLVNSLVYIENHTLLDPSQPRRNPAIEWGRFARAVWERAVHWLDPEHESPGGSTLATQIACRRCRAAGLADEGHDGDGGTGPGAGAGRGADRYGGRHRPTQALIIAHPDRDVARTRRDAAAGSDGIREPSGVRAVASTVVGGQATFIELMNVKAHSLGMERTRFVDPTGLSHQNVSTAREIVKMARAASHYPLITEFTTLSHHRVTVSARTLAYRTIWIALSIFSSPRWAASRSLASPASKCATTGSRNILASCGSLRWP